jgi:hypothetical protein
MSATNRGAKRVEADFYPTPVSVIEHFLKHHKLNSEGAIYEPSAGNGNFNKAIKDYGYQNELIANELREEEHSNLVQNGAKYIYHEDFLEGTIPDHNISTIITNPPYSHAREFIARCKELYPNAEIIMLLRLAFLESKGRHEFWQQNPVSKLYTLSQRPSFINGKTDATAYAWFVWNRENKQEIRVI